MGQTGGGLVDGREGIGLRKKGLGKGRYNFFFKLLRLLGRDGTGYERRRKNKREYKGTQFSKEGHIRSGVTTYIHSQSDYPIIFNLSNFISSCAKKWQA